VDFFIGKADGGQGVCQGVVAGGGGGFRRDVSRDFYNFRGALSHSGKHHFVPSLSGWDMD
jgi:hypothetical protein